MLALAGILWTVLSISPLDAGPEWELGSQSPAEQTVKAMAELLSAEARFPDPKDFYQRLNEGKKPGDFDPNRFFSVLKHLSMEPGFVLDYVYAYDGHAGQPMLYALRAGAQPRASPASYDAAEAAADAFLHVILDGTPESYFELVVLRIMGERFYIYWHAIYNDFLPVSGNETLDSLLKGLDASLDILPEDIEPDIKFSEETATISLLAFSKWAGLARLTYQCKRSFPHAFVQYDYEVLIPYNSGVVF